VCPSLVYTQLHAFNALQSVLGTSLFASSIIAILVHACSQTGAPASRHVTQRPAVTDHLVVTVLPAYDARRFVSFFPTIAHQNDYCHEQQTAVTSLYVSERCLFLSALFEGLLAESV
jgi:hypothetical protein